MANKMTLLLAILLFLSLVLLNFIERFSQTGSTIRYGSSIIAGSTNSWVVSPSGDFAFGFYPLPNNLYLVGIWFHKTKPKTLVWSANRDNPAPASSVVQLNSTGQFVLSFPNGGMTQSIFTEQQQAPAISGQMQNDGNFVLKDSNSKVVGQSFDSPTDTLLPGQILGVDKKMFSAKNISDFSTGKFMLQMRQNGNLELSNCNENFYPYGYWFRILAIIPNSVLVFDNTYASMYLAHQKNPIGGQRFRNLTVSVPAPIGDYYHRATIDVDGEFRQYVYSKIKGREWTSVWGAISHDPCLSNKTVACDCVWQLFHWTRLSF